MTHAELSEPRCLPLSNEEVALRLSAAADLLDAQHANPFRVNAYRWAAETVRSLTEPVIELLNRDGPEGLQKLPGIGQSLAHAIEQLTRIGRSTLLDQIRGTTRPERILTTVASIGAKTAARLHEELGIDSLAELEAAAYDGRLAKFPGMGQKRLRAVQESLAGRFRRRRPSAPTALQTNDPPVAELLDVDEEYRRKAAADRLPRISPRRFNPTGEAWLPILHTHRGDRQYTAFFSNTARAHELGTTRDWVVIHRDDRDGDGQWTAITSRFGKCKGRRVIRGRERECAQHYESAALEERP